MPAHQQCAGHRDLGHDQARADPAHAEARRPRALVFEQLVHVDPGRFEGGNDTGGDAGHQGHRDGKEQYRSIRSELHPIWFFNALRDEGVEHVDERGRNEHSCNAADQRKDGSFDHELTNHAPAARAQGRANRHFLDAGGGAGQQQVRHIQARDDQHSEHRGHRDPGHGDEFRWHEFVNIRLNGRAYTVVGFGVLGGEALGDPRHLSQ